MLIKERQAGRACASTKSDSDRRAVRCGILRVLTSSGFSRGTRSRFPRSARNRDAATCSTRVRARHSGGRDDSEDDGRCSCQGGGHRKAECRQELSCQPDPRRGPHDRFGYRRYDARRHRQLCENEYGTFTFIDTAGIRRQSRVLDKIEKYSVLRAHAAVERADVCLILIDATEGITEQDEKIAGIAHEAGKASVIVVNKWDLVEKDNSAVNVLPTISERRLLICRMHRSCLFRQRRDRESSPVRADPICE